LRDYYYGHGIGQVIHGVLEPVSGRFDELVGNARSSASTANFVSRCKRIRGG
jgi:hypothetical protein